MACIVVNTLTQPISQLGFGHFVSLTLTDVVRASGSEWQVSKGGTSFWETLYKTPVPLRARCSATLEVTITTFVMQQVLKDPNCI
jgi:hypothetical protein